MAKKYLLLPHSLEIGSRTGKSYDEVSTKTFKNLGSHRSLSYVKDGRFREPLFSVKANEVSKNQIISYSAQIEIFDRESGQLLDSASATSQSLINQPLKKDLGAGTSVIFTCKHE